MRRPSAPIAGAIIGGLVIAQSLFVIGYVEHERTIYFWDHAMYIGMARQFYAAFGQSFSAAWDMFRQSLANNYNLLFAVPSLLSFSLFAPTRTVFIATNFWVFFLAYECAVALLLRRALDFRWDTAFAVTLIASFLIPPLWLPLLEGYPDNGAAACITLAAALGIGGVGQAKPIRRGLLLGVLLSLAVLLRRHFVYPAFALLTATGCFALGTMLRSTNNRRQHFLHTVLYFAAAGMGFGGLLLLVAPDFLRDALTTDYRSLYLSYQRPALVFVRFALGGFGFGLLLAAAAGLVFMVRAGGKPRVCACYVTLFTLLWLVIWCAGPDQMGHHYILHALPLLATIGFAGWIVWLAQKPDRRKCWFAGAVFCALALNSAWALWFSPTGVWPNDNGAPGLLSAARPPVVRSDYDEWLRLADYLRRTSKDDDRIMMVGSSFVFNQDLLHSIYMENPATAYMIFRMPKTPEIDHEEPAPFDAFAGADIYVVPTPPQYHLDPAGQRVVTAGANQFPPPAAYADLFHKDDETFQLADGVTVDVWRRKAWTPGKLHRALQKIRADGPQDANFTQDWATAVLPLRAQIRTNTDGLTLVDGLFGPGQGHMRLFFDRPLTEGNYIVSFTVGGDCPDPRLHISLQTSEGHTIKSRDFAPLVLPSQMADRFAVPSSADGDYFMQIDITTVPVSLCHTAALDLQTRRE